MFPISSGTLFTCDNTSIEQENQKSLKMNIRLGVGHRHSFNIVVCTGEHFPAHYRYHSVVLENMSIWSPLLQFWTARGLWRLWGGQTSYRGRRGHHWEKITRRAGAEAQNRKVRLAWLCESSSSWLLHINITAVKSRSQKFLYDELV